MSAVLNAPPLPTAAAALHASEVHADELLIWQRDICIALLDVLENESNEALRFHALRCLGKISTTDGVAERIAAIALGMEDPDEDVRTEATVAMSRQTGADVEPLLLRTLREDPNPDCKLAAIAGLSELKVMHDPSILIELCATRGQHVNWDDDQADGWDDWLDVQVNSIRAVAKFGLSKGVADIERALYDEQSQELASQACAAFTQLGENGSAALRRCLASPRERLRRAAVTAIVTAPHEHDVAYLQRLLDDPQVEVKRAAFEALVKLDRADLHIENMLRQPSSVLLVSALRHCRAEHFERVAALTHNHDVHVRVAAAQAISRLANSDALDRHDADSGLVRNTLADALPDLLVDAESEVVVAAMHAAFALHKNRSLHLLTHLLRDEDKPSSVRCCAASVIAQITGSESMNVLAPILRDDDWQVRRSALTAASQRAVNKDEYAIGALQSLLEQYFVEMSTCDIEPENADPTQIPVLDISAENEEGQDLAGEQHLSTLDSILADNERVQDFPELVLDEQDAQRMSNTDIKPRGRKHISLQPDSSAGLDAAHFSAKTLGQCPGEHTLVLLEQALYQDDEELVSIALNSLNQIAAIAPSSPAILERLAELAEHGAPSQQVKALRLLMQYNDARGAQFGHDLLIAAKIPARQELLQFFVQAPLKIDASFEDEVVGLFQIEALRSLSLSVIAVMNPQRVIEHLLDLIAFGDDSVQQTINTLIRKQQLPMHKVADKLLLGLRDPAWQPKRLWLLEALEALV